MLKPETRSNYVMVDEDDPLWRRFWDAYPRRCSKKDARKVWAKLNPSPEVVDQMLYTLSWQSQEWARDSFRFTPYPASWLNAERWTDEPPPRVTKTMSDAAAMVFQTLGVKP